MIVNTIYSTSGRETILPYAYTIAMIFQLHKSPARNTANKQQDRSEYLSVLDGQYIASNYRLTGNYTQSLVLLSQSHALIQRLIYTIALARIIQRPLTLSVMIYQKSRKLNVYSISESSSEAVDFLRNTSYDRRAIVVIRIDRLEPIIYSLII